MVTHHILQQRHTHSLRQLTQSLYHVLLEQHHQMTEHAYRQVLQQAFLRQQRAILLQRQAIAARQAIQVLLSVQLALRMQATVHVYSLALHQALAQKRQATVLVRRTQTAQAQQATVLVRPTQAARFSVLLVQQILVTGRAHRTLAQAMDQAQLTQVAMSRSIVTTRQQADTQQRRQHRQTLTCLSVSKLPLTNIIENPRLNVGFFMF